MAVISYQPGKKFVVTWYKEGKLFYRSGFESLNEAVCFGNDLEARNNYKQN